MTVDTDTTAQSLTLADDAVLTENDGAELTVTGDLVNSGTLRCIRSIAAPGGVSFGLTGASISVDTVGTLSSIQVDRIDSDVQPAGLPALETGRYWNITPTGGGFTASLTLPYDSTQVSDPMLARYDGSRWISDRSSNTATHVTLAGVQAFSRQTRLDIASEIGKPERCLSIEAIVNGMPRG